MMKVNKLLQAILKASLAVMAFGTHVTCSFASNAEKSMSGDGPVHQRMVKLESEINKFQEKICDNIAPATDGATELDIIEPKAITKDGSPIDKISIDLILETNNLIKLVKNYAKVMQMRFSEDGEIVLESGEDFGAVTDHLYNKAVTVHHKWYCIKSLVLSAFDLWDEYRSIDAHIVYVQPYIASILGKRDRL